MRAQISETEIAKLKENLNADLENVSTKNIYNWKEKVGPTIAKYNRTKHRSNGTRAFENWFINHLIPITKKKDEQQVVIDNNLSLHINPRVLTESEKHKS